MRSASWPSHLLAAETGKRHAAAAAWLLVAGLVIFCGSLYVLALTGTRGWGALAPVGGSAFLAAWGADARVGVAIREFARSSHANPST